MTNIAIALSHSIEEHDQLRLLAGLGYGVFSIGGYIDPAHPHDPKRPPLDIPFYPELKAAVDGLGTDDNLGAAQQQVPDAILEWADVLIYHHYLPRLWGQWPRIRDWLRGGNRRVIWRTVGQSLWGNELEAQPYRAQGLEIVRYSPNERNIPNFAGEDALIRFYKDPAEWTGWTGELQVVINITQHLRQREPSTNWNYWEQATAGLPRMALGPGSEVIGGPGEMDYHAMCSWLRRSRAYVYTGTQPASYTLGLLEALMTGIPVISIPPTWMRQSEYGPDLFEGADLCLASGEPGTAREWCQALLTSPSLAASVSEKQREQTIATFGIEPVAAAWKAYLG